jgi:hypothetical protein
MEHSNELSLSKRLSQLAARTTAATSALIGNSRDRQRWAGIVSAVRNDLTHLGADEQKFEASDLVWLAESVFAVLRVCMLQESGISNEVLSRLATNDRVNWYRQRLMASVESVRAELRDGS